MFLFQHISCHNLDLLSNYTYVMLVEFLRLTNLSVYVKHWYGHKNESVDRIYKNLVQTCIAMSIKYHLNILSIRHLM